MKKHFFLFVCLFCSMNIYGQYDTIVHPQMVNLVTLIVDYQTYNFDSGNISYYDCPNCTNDSLPLFADYESPGDFGSINFSLNPSMDLFFGGTIVWMGTGSINYPNNFTVTPPFFSSSISIDLPTELQYLDVNGQVMQSPSLIQEANLAWEAVRNLEITSIFSQNNFQVAIYFYAPSTGAFDPNPAKWIIFLYTNTAVNSLNEIVNELNDVKLYPNPSTSKLNIVSKEGIQKCTVYTLNGELVLNSYFNIQELDISSLKSGLYLLDVEFENGSRQIKKFTKY